MHIISIIINIYFNYHYHYYMYVCFIVDKKPIAYPDGEYEGNVDSNGKRHGWGKMTYKTSDVATYVGEWSNDQWHGRGIRTKVDGRKFEGNLSRHS